jgi:DNA gyrase subunit A
VQNRGGKGVRGAALRGDDLVEHMFATTSHHWILFFTTAGRVYRAKAYQLPEAGRDAKGGHVAGLLSFQPDEEIAQVLAIRDYEQAPYLVLATKKGLVKKTRLGDYNSPRQAGVIAINFRDEDDELIGAELVTPEDDLILISRKAQAIRFRADDEQLRPMGRATSGVTGMKFREADSMLSMSVIRRSAGALESTEVPEEDQLYVFTVTDGGFAKKTPVEQYRLQGRGGLGIKAMQITENRGELVGGLVLVDTDDVISVTAGGQVTRSLVSGVNPTGRGTMGVSFVKFKGDDRVVTIARNTELLQDEAQAEETSTDEDQDQ